MPTRNTKKTERAYRPATTPEGRENQLVSMAIDLTERRMRNGTASAQEVTHFLKLGSTRERLEQERLRSENTLLKAKVESMASGKRVEELYDAAIKAMRTYAGQADDEPEEYYD